MIFKESPFKENGTLKPKFVFYNGHVWFTDGPGRQDTPAMKNDTEKWSLSDCSNIVRRLVLSGVNIKKIASKLNIKEGSAKNLMNGVARITRKNMEKLEKIEASINKTNQGE